MQMKLEQKAREDIETQIKIEHKVWEDIQTQIAELIRQMGNIIILEIHQTYFKFPLFGGLNT